MSQFYERIVSGTLGIAAIVMSLALVHREFATPRDSGARGPTAPPQQVKDWQAIQHAGILMGDSTAPVKIVEFGDFECPFCRTFAKTVSTMRTRFGDSVSLVFIQLPLEQIHRFAMPAARAAECANAQGRFSAFYETTYAKQDSLGLKSWVSFATDAGVQDTAKFARCNSYTGPLLDVQLAKAIANKLNIHATPTVIVNGWRFAAPPDDSLLTRIASAILSGKSPSIAVSQ